MTNRLDYQWNEKTKRLDLLWSYESGGNCFYKTASIDIRKILEEVDVQS